MHSLPESPLFPERTLIPEVSDNATEQPDSLPASDNANGQSGSEPPQGQPDATVQGGPGGQDKAELPLVDQGMVSSVTENIQDKKDTMEIGWNALMGKVNPNLRSFSSNVSESDNCLVPLAPAPTTRLYNLDRVDTGGLCFNERVYGSGLQWVYDSIP